MKRILLASSVFALGACGTKSKPTKAHDAKVAPVVPADSSTAKPAPAAFAALFTQGASWTFSVVSERPDRPASDPVTVVCNSSSYTEADGITSIEITCGDEWPTIMSADPLTGGWAMSANGVWRSKFAGAGVAPELNDFMMVMGSESMFTAAQKGDAWCYQYRPMSPGGESSPIGMCVGPDGPTEGTYGDVDGPQVKFTRVP